MLKLLEVNKENTLQDIGVGKNFLNRTPIAQEIAPRINRWGYMKLKSFCRAKELTSRANSSQNGKKSLPATLQTGG